MNAPNPEPLSESNSEDQHQPDQDQPVSNQVWNVPNVASGIRLLMSFAVFAMIPFDQYLAGLILFVVAAGTDWFDGWYARRYNQVTQLGRILDPFCDKILICGTFILLAVAMDEFPWYLKIAGWMAVVVVGREMLVTALRGFIEQHGGDFSAKMAGKLKMVFQCVAAGAGLVALMYNASSPVEAFDSLPAWISITLIGSVWLSVIFTIYSGIEYILAAARFMKNLSA